MNKNIWIHQTNLSVEISKIDKRFELAFNEAKTKEEKETLHDSYLKEAEYATKSAKIHAMSKKHYTFRIIVQEDLADFNGDIIHSPNSVDIGCWVRTIASVARKCERTMESWLPETNYWDNYFRYVYKVERTTDREKMILDCFFKRIEYLDPDELFKYILKIYLGVLDKVEKINDEHKQHFSIIVKGRQDNEWFELGDWPPEEGHWKTILKINQPLPAAGNRART